METLRYSRLGKEDLALGTDTFEVRLADGRWVALRQIDIGYFYGDAFTTAAGPGTLTTGQLYRVTDGLRGLWGLSQARTPFRLGGPVVLAEEFGVRPSEAAATNTTRMQTLLDRLNDAGGGILQLGLGTYELALADTTRALRIYPTVTIRGAGRDVTTLKLASSQGNYRAIFAPDPLTADVSDFALLDLTLDQNTTGNPVAQATDVTDPGQNRCAVYVTVGARLTVARCRFTDIDSMQVLGLFDNAGATTITDLRVVDNEFDAVGGSIDHDHSTVYAHADRCVIAGNTFRARSAGLRAARSAMETHGSQVRVVGNIVVDYHAGYQLTGSAAASDGVVVAGNVIEGARWGIVVWSLTDGPLTNALIADNTIRLSHSTWDLPTAGLILEAVGTAGVQNVRIAGNLIRLVGALGTVSVSDSAGSGIQWDRVDTSLVDVNLSVVENIIDGALAAGILLTTSLRGARVAGNLIRNPGLSTGAFSDDFRSAVLLGTDTATDVVIEDNVVVDDQVASTIKHGIRNAAVTSLANVHVRHNPLRVADGTAIAEYDENETKTGVWVETAHGGTLVRTFTSLDATPSVKDGRLFQTANASATTITTFDGGVVGQTITVLFNDANTTVDFTASGLKGNGGADWSPTTGDSMTCTYDGTDWFCRISDNTA